MINIVDNPKPANDLRLYQRRFCLCNAGAQQKETKVTVVFFLQNGMASLNLNAIANANGGNADEFD